MVNILNIGSQFVSKETKIYHSAGLVYLSVHHFMHKHIWWFSNPESGHWSPAIDLRGRAPPNEEQQCNTYVFIFIPKTHEFTWLGLGWGTSVRLQYHSVSLMNAHKNPALFFLSTEIMMMIIDKGSLRWFHKFSLCEVAASETTLSLSCQ